MRSNCGMFDVSHMCAVDVVGPDEGLPAPPRRQQRRQALLPGKALYSAMLNEAGGVNRRPDHLLLERHHLPCCHQRRHGDQGPRVDGRPPEGIGA